MGVRFHNTLFDENAANHIALGHGLQFTLREDSTLSEEDFAARGGNVSNIYVDFILHPSAFILAPSFIPFQN